MENTTILSNLLAFIPRHKFNRFVKKYEGDKWCKKLSVYQHFTAMLYAVVSGCSSLRDLENSFNSNHQAFKDVRCLSTYRSSISYMNQKSNLLDIYKDVFDYLLSMALNNDKISRSEYVETNKVTNIIDSTEITLNSNSKDIYPSKCKKPESKFKVHIITDYCKDLPKEVYFSEHNVNDITIAKELVKIESNQIYIFDRGYHDYSWWKEIDNNNSIFISRLKKNSICQNRKTLSIDFTNKDIISDSSFNSGSRLSHSRNHPYKNKRLREVVVKDDNGKILRIVTNDFKMSAEDVARLYKARWSIELFFKWLKQNLKIKKFYGYSKNAIKIQIYIALISYILLKLLKQITSCNSKSFTEFVRICKCHLMELVDNILTFFYPPPNNKPKQKKINKQLSLNI